MIPSQGGGRRVGSTVAAALAALLGLALGPGCSTTTGLKFRGTTAMSFLRQVQEDQDPNARYVAYQNLGQLRCYDDEEQKARVAQVLSTKMGGAEEPVATRAVICRTLGAIGRPEGREAVLAAVNDEDPLVRSEACLALGRVGRSEDATILVRVMTADVAGECRIAAIESLGQLKSSDRRITEYLVTGMEHDDPAIRVASMQALRSITGKDFGVDAIAWKKYVETLPKGEAPNASSDSTITRTSGQAPGRGRRRVGVTPNGLPTRGTEPAPPAVPRPF